MFKPRPKCSGGMILVVRSELGFVGVLGGRPLPNCAPSDTPNLGSPPRRSGGLPLSWLQLPGIDSPQFGRCMFWRNATVP